MAIKCKTGNVVDASFAVVKLKNAHMGLSIVDKAKIARFLKPILAELAEYERVHLDLVKKYGKPIGGDRYQISEEHIADYNKENKDLRDIDVELAISPLPEDFFTTIDTALSKENKGFSPEDMLALEPFVTWPPEV